WSPYFMMFVVGLGVLYYLITGPYRHKFGGQDSPSVKPQSFFYIVLLLLYIVKGLPLDLMAHILLTTHMIQMAIFYFVFLILSIILIAAFIMWLPVLQPIKEFKKMKPLVKLAYIAGNGLLITPACALIIFAEAPIYAAYSSSGAWIQSLSLCVPGNVLDGLA